MVLGLATKNLVGYAKLSYSHALF